MWMNLPRLINNLPIQNKKRWHVQVVPPFKMLDFYIVWEECWYSQFDASISDALWRRHFYFFDILAFYDKQMYGREEIDFPKWLLEYYRKLETSSSRDI